MAVEERVLGEYSDDSSQTSVHRAADSSGRSVFVGQTDQYSVCPPRKHRRDFRQQKNRPAHPSLLPGGWLCEAFRRVRRGSLRRHKAKVSAMKCAAPRIERCLPDDVCEVVITALHRLDYRTSVWRTVPATAHEFGSGEPVRPDSQQMSILNQSSQYYAAAHSSIFRENLENYEKHIVF